MMSKKKNILNAAFLVIVFAATLYYIFHGQDMGVIMGYIQNADIRYWVLAILCVVFFIASESVIIYYMMHTIKHKVRMVHCLLYSFIGFFFSCITPAATGGQPAQIYYMRKDKIPVPVSTLVLMIVTVTYKMVLVIIGIAVFVFRPGKIMYYLHPVLGWCYLGLVLNTLCVVFMLLLIFHPTMAKTIITAVFKALNRIHVIKRIDHYLEKVDRAMQQYQDVSVYFGTHKMVVWNVLVITIVQRCVMFYVTYLTCLSFGLRNTDMVTIVALQGMISVAVEMLPLPGGMGISEKLFLSMFVPICGTITLPAMVVSRGLSFYTELIISAIFTIVAHLVIGRERERKN